MTAAATTGDPVAEGAVAGGRSRATAGGPHLAGGPLAGTVAGDAIALVGCACRLPGAPSPDAFWSLLRAGRDALTPVPPDRRPGHPTPGHPTPGYGGFLDGVDRFDPAFFGISPQEAAAMDPQQRLVLELAWEALEDAGSVPARLRGAAVGVFVGVMADDYATLTRRQDPGLVGRHTLTGLSRGVIANRVAFTLGLRGPSLAVDSGQSSSAVAVHLACASIRAGECTLALAAGVNLNLVAESTLPVARLGVLSPDGRCFTFDARANGYVRGEGGAVVVLKPLARALADGDRVYCTILGGAVQSTGDAASLVAPDAGAQEQLLRTAYARAGVDPTAVQYVELHGTGTPTGDVVEAAALGAALGVARAPDAPLPVGSVKTNIGHLEGAAGIAGILKVALAIRHRQVPASLNFVTPNPGIPLDRLNLRVQRTTGPWPVPDAPLLAGVSSFGLGGTGCHLVLGEPPLPAPHPARRAAARHPLAWPLSARDRPALAAQAARLDALLATDPGLHPADIGRSLATTRSLFEHRAVVVARDCDGFRRGLAGLARRAPGATVVEGRTGTPGGTVFVFPGQGSQWAGMGRELMRTAPAFRARIRACDSAFRPHLGWSLADVLCGAPGAPTLERDDVVQPALLAMMLGLAALWQSVGVRPEAVVGHSQGEIAAACVAGALPLAQAAALVVRRSAAAGSLRGSGGMAAIALPAEQVAARLAGAAGPSAAALSIAAVNGPLSTVVSGPPAALADLLTACERDGVRCRRMPVSYASHSPAVDVLRDGLVAGLAELRPRAARTAFYSTVTGDRLVGTELDAGYWFRNLRQPVRFASAVQALRAAGHGTFIEISPHPILTASIEETLDGDADPGTGALEPPTVVGSLRRDDGGWDRFLLSAARVHVRGTPVTWPTAGGRRVPLPTYPFQRQRYWLDGDVSTVDNRDPAGGLAARLAGLDGPSRDRLLHDEVLAHVAAVLGHPEPAALPPLRTFKDLGFDSPAALELRGRLQEATGVPLPATIVFDHPTPAALADHLRDRLRPPGGSGTRPTDPDAQPPAGTGTRPTDPDDELIAALEAELGAPPGWPPPRRDRD